MNKVSDKVKENLINDCHDFYEKYKTLNDVAIKKHNSSLSSRVNKYYGDLSKMSKDCKDLPPDHGSRIWTYRRTLPLLQHSPKNLQCPLCVARRSLGISLVNHPSLDWILLLFDITCT